MKKTASLEVGFTGENPILKTKEENGVVIIQELKSGENFEGEDLKILSRQPLEWLKKSQYQYQTKCGKYYVFHDGDDWFYSWENLEFICGSEEAGMRYCEAHDKDSESNPKNQETSKFPLCDNDDLLSFAALLETFESDRSSLWRWCENSNSPTLFRDYVNLIGNWKLLGYPNPGQFPCRNTPEQVMAGYNQLKSICDIELDREISFGHSVLFKKYSVLLAEIEACPILFRQWVSYSGMSEESVRSSISKWRDLGCPELTWVQMPQFLFGDKFTNPSLIILSRKNPSLRIELL